MELRGTKVVVGLSGGIAAYKGIELVRELLRRGAEVRTVLTPNAARFIGPVTLTGLTGKPPVLDLWDPSYSGEVHVELGAWADAMVVAPATMNTIAKLAQGFADDPLSATASCLRGRLVLAPAMHTRMWSRPATQRNLATLRGDGATVVGPVEGPLASGEVGMGRMAEPVAIADALTALLARPQDLAGLRLLVSAGPTIEDFDPVRFLGNRSTGKMGFAIASAARDRGAEVTLVTGPVELADPPGVAVVRVRSALEMHRAILDRAATDAIVMSAAVADYRPAEYHADKVKKAGTVTIELVRNPDILLELGQNRVGALPVLVGFALETKDVEAYARDKLVRKKVDLVVANEARVGFGGDENEALLVTADATLPLPRMTKTALADRILDRIRELHSGRKTT